MKKRARKPQSRRGRRVVRGENRAARSSWTMCRSRGCWPGSAHASRSLKKQRRSGLSRLPSLMWHTGFGLSELAPCRVLGTLVTGPAFLRAFWSGRSERLFHRSPRSSLEARNKRCSTSFVGSPGLAGRAPVSGNQTVWNLTKRLDLPNANRSDATSYFWSATPGENPLKWVRGITGFNRFFTRRRRSRPEKWGNSPDQFPGLTPKFRGVRKPPPRNEFLGYPT